MTTSSTQFTVTSLVAAAAEVLEGAGFKAVEPSITSTWRATATRVYEDAYSVVCVAVYETWTDLSARWVEDQATLVNLISEYFARSEPKAWDGYLVLLTPSVVRQIDRQNANSIERNTLHLRKLFADGEELQSISDVRRTLLPLLPLEEYDALVPRNVLDTLPRLLGSHGVDEEAAQVAIGAFREQRPIIAAIHAFMTQERG